MLLETMGSQWNMRSPLGQILIDVVGEDCTKGRGTEGIKELEGIKEFRRVRRNKVIELV